MKSRRATFKLVVAFTMLIGIFLGFGWLALNRMALMNANIQEMSDRRWPKVQLSREALRYSAINSRITMQIFLLDDRKEIDSLLEQRASNSEKISELLKKIETKSAPDTEKPLVAAIWASRNTYMESYKQALGLLLKDGQPAAGREMMAKVVTPNLIAYHKAWDNFVTFQGERMDEAGDVAENYYVTAHRLVLLLLLLASILACIIAVIVTRGTASEILNRLRAEKGLREAHEALERRVEQRTMELSTANAELTTTHRDLQASEKNQRQFALQLGSEKQRLVAAQAVAKVGSWETDLVSLAVNWSEETNRIFETNPTTFQPTHERFLESVHPDDRARVNERFLQSTTEPGIYAMEHRLLMQDGRIKFVEERWQTVFEQERPVRAIGTCHDITERELAKSALLDSKHFLQSTLDALSSHIAILDEHGTIIEVNAAWNRFASENNLKGRHRGVGDNYLQLCDAAFGNFSEEASVVAKGIRTVMAGESVEFHLEYPCHSPKDQRWFIVRVTRFAGSGPVRVVVAHENITKRKQAEALLLESQQRLALAKESAHMGIWDWDVVTNTMVWDPQMYELYGIREEDFCGAYEAWQKGLHPADRDQSEADLRAALEGRKDFHTEFRVVWPNGDVRDIEAHALLRRASDGSVTRMIGVNWDITARKRAEAELEKTNKNLLETSRQAGMAEVATGVLHNVGNVLNSVNVASSCLINTLRKSKATNLSKVVKLLHDHENDLGAFFTENPKGKQIPGYLAQLTEHLAIEQAGALKELAGLQSDIEHIKDIVSMQQSFAKVSGTKETLSITDLVEDALKMNSSSLARHDIIVTKEFQKVPPISVEKHKILQILVNLVRNAKQACDASGSMEKRLTLRVTNGNDRVRIAVTDNGIGIPSENFTRIFAHGFTTKKSGHGFGLHSGALAAKEMGGSLTAYSDGLDLGSTFTLELPTLNQVYKN